ncbi:hypothetical protein XOC_3549 [Xanthomonas oryzae pv. oryzicola BLS256]|uniref:Uncharacterized protein n=1 Tax=Xanthomonas oryzae pv. oryzicola (strain BLS256) TaxID=383407 RepID=G7TEC4_XANOB|nr:hypothetical protein XOC_3549 [Xanthomonas oryzae pv. oryzicola BLS256]QEO96208.1 hypothetical protein XOCgx_1214 [Xanthomonas oryzae pv. oryzicola]
MTRFARRKQVVEVAELEDASGHGGGLPGKKRTGSIVAVSCH